VEELTEDQVLSILNKMDKEQKFFEQMNSARAFLREIITRYQTIRANIPKLAEEESKLRENIRLLESEHHAQKIKLRNSLTTAHEELTSSMQAEMEPLKVAYEEARERVSTAEAKAAEVETTCKASVEADMQAANNASLKRVAAEAALAKFVNKFAVV